jgi:hypothetical protein
MKELQMGIQLVKTKLIHSQPVKRLKGASTQGIIGSVGDNSNDRISSQKRATLQQHKRSACSSASLSPKPLLAFPVSLSLEMLRLRTSKGVRRLENQAKRINQLSAELEAAVLELKAIASEVNPDWKAIQTTQNSSAPANVCEYRTTTVPQVQPKANGSFLLISKPVDLFQAEREATLLAQTLRHRSKTKQKRQLKLK